MTGKERMTRILRREKTDRIGLYEHLWTTTHRKWIEDGHLKKDEPIASHFNFDLDEVWAISTMADYNMKPIVVAEDEETITTKDGNGAILRNTKHHESTPEHIGFEIQTSDQYYEKIKPRLFPELNRINVNSYVEVKERCARENRFFALSGVNVFECMHPVIGHEQMLVGMALEPEWIAEMAMDYAKLVVGCQEILFSKYGKPDGIWYYEDMGFKERPFMSPAMYRELIQPAHEYTINFAKSQGLPVIMHSCGFIEPLLPYMVEAGIDCLQVIEIKAGMDLLRIYKNFGDRLSLMGGIDVRVLSQSRDDIDRELEAKIPVVKEGFGFALHSDHSIPSTVSYDTYKYFIDRAFELGRLD